MMQYLYIANKTIVYLLNYSSTRFIILQQKKKNLSCDFKHLALFFRLLLFKYF